MSNPPNLLTELDNLIPVVLKDELIGYIPDRGQEASFYDVSKPQWTDTEVRIKRCRYSTDEGLDHYYLADGERGALLKAVHDIGVINDSLITGMEAHRTWGVINGV